MSEIWSKTPPTEDGWYWIKTDRGFPGDCEPIGRGARGIRNGKDVVVWSTGEHLQEDCTDAEMIQYGYEFGPRIPGPEQLARMNFIEQLGEATVGSYTPTNTAVTQWYVQDLFRDEFGYGPTRNEAIDNLIATQKEREHVANLQ